MFIVLLSGFFTKLSDTKGWRIVYGISLGFSILTGLASIVAFPAIIIWAIVYFIGYGLASLIK